MPPRKTDPYAKRVRRGAKIHLPAVNDPTPKAVAGRGNITGQDYTKFIKWTPTKIVVFAICVSAPYLAAVAVLWVKFGFGAAMGLLALGLGVAAFIGLMYWFAKASL
ncbi:MAG: hypothetical protein ACKO7W_13045 [Elainella sp.]